MDFLKELFTKPLSFEEFSAAVTSKGIKLADLSSGEYVAKGKLTEATDKAKALTDKVAAYEKTIGELKAAAGDADGLKGRIAEPEKTIADRDAAEKAEFQSTPSAGRATVYPLIAKRAIIQFQSTPSAGRATVTSSALYSGTLISIHALRGEGDADGRLTLADVPISIHALRGEGDERCDTAKIIEMTFQSTPSAGRATILHPQLSRSQKSISIHALRGEGDFTYYGKRRI